MLSNGVPVCDHTGVTAVTDDSLLISQNRNTSYHLLRVRLLPYTRHRVTSMKLKFTFSILLLLFLIIKICSCVKLDEKDDDEDSSSADSDYDDSKSKNENTSSSKVDKEKEDKKGTLDEKKKQDEKEAKDSDRGESDYGDDGEDDGETTTNNKTALPFAVEGESLRRLQQFILTGVENAIKNSLPMIIRSASETNVSSQCSASFLTLISALRESKLWAFKSKFDPGVHLSVHEFSNDLNLAFVRHSHSCLLLHLHIFTNTDNNNMHM